VLNFRCFVGRFPLEHLVCVYASTDVVVVCEVFSHTIAVTGVVFNG
jgi:hypothetical protein